VLIPTPPPFAYDEPTHPVTLLASYYNAINLRQFDRAYGYWFQPPQPFDAFAAGFADTLAVRLVVGPPALPPDGHAPIGVPVLLFAWHRDASEHIFSGCFYVGKTSEGGDISQWRIIDARIQATQTADVTQLQHACDPLQSLLDLPRWDWGTQPEDVIFSYYNAIVQRDFERAYGYWEAPPQPYDQFAAGFANTTSAFVALIPHDVVEGAMGSQYAAIPTIILAQHRDGSRPTFAGCFITRRPNPAMVGEERPWRIYNATVQSLPDNSTDAHVLLDLPAPCP